MKLKSCWHEVLFFFHKRRAVQWGKLAVSIFVINLYLLITVWQILSAAAAITPHSDKPRQTQSLAVLFDTNSMALTDASMKIVCNTILSTCMFSYWNTECEAQRNLSLICGGKKSEPPVEKASNSVGLIDWRSPWGKNAMLKVLSFI